MRRGEIIINIQHKPDEGYATVSVANTGSYISQRNLQKIRERIPFSTKQRFYERWILYLDKYVPIDDWLPFLKMGDGHGKGMQIVYDVIEKYGGRLRVSSGKRERITLFEIDLPYNRHVKPIHS